MEKDLITIYLLFHSSIRPSYYLNEKHHWRIGPVPSPIFSVQNYIRIILYALHCNKLESFFMPQSMLISSLKRPLNYTCLSVMEFHFSSGFFDIVLVKLSLFCVNNLFLFFMVSSWLTAPPPPPWLIISSQQSLWLYISKVMLQQLGRRSKPEWDFLISLKKECMLIIFPNYESNFFSMRKFPHFVISFEWCFVEEWVCVWGRLFSTWSIIPANPETWQGCRLQLPVSSYKGKKILPHGNTYLIEWWLRAAAAAEKELHKNLHSLFSYRYTKRIIIIIIMCV